MKEKYLMKRSGGAMVFMLIIFMIITIFATSILFIFNTNLKQTKYQEARIEAYYLAYSGAEAAYSSLLENDRHNLNRIITNPSIKLGPNKVSFGNGEILITAQQTQDKNFKDWIKITSTGTLDKKDISYTRILYFNPDPGKLAERVWKDD